MGVLDAPGIPRSSRMTNAALVPLVAEAVPVDASIGAFRWTIGETTFNAQVEGVHRFGYNLPAAGRTTLNTEPTFGWAVESHYYDGSVHYCETYWEFQGIDRAKVYRPIVGAIDRLTDRGSLSFQFTTYPSATPGDIRFTDETGAVALSVTKGPNAGELRLGGSRANKISRDSTNGGSYFGFNMVWDGGADLRMEHDQLAALAGIHLTATGAIDFYSAASTAAASAALKALSILTTGEMRSGYGRTTPFTGLTISDTNYGFGRDASDLAIWFPSGQGLRFKTDSVSGTERVRITNASLIISNALDHDGSTVGFNGATPVGKRTLGAAATDLASVITLANNLRQALIDLGLGQT